MPEFRPQSPAHSSAMTFAFLLEYAGPTTIWRALRAGGPTLEGDLRGYQNLLLCRVVEKGYRLSDCSVDFSTEQWSHYVRFTNATHVGTSL